MSEPNAHLSCLINYSLVFAMGLSGMKSGFLDSSGSCQRHSEVTLASERYTTHFSISNNYDSQISFQ